jgi:hypothetical protein
MEPRARSPYGVAMELLAQRRYAEAWPLYEERRRHSSQPPPTPIARQPEWRGEPIDGKTVVVCAEQGWGDQLLFGRFLPELKSRGAHVIVACDHTVIGSVFYFAGFEVTPFYVDRPLHGGDYWVPIGSLPYLLESEWPPTAVWAKAEITGGGGVGVVAKGNPQHWNDAHRSLHGPDAERLARFGCDLQPASGAGDLSYTASRMGRLDLVISVDTAAANLAGTIGARCWVLLPYSGLDWRWNDGVRSDWFPQMRLFRQRRPGDWQAVLDEVSLALKADGLL